MSHNKKGLEQHMQGQHPQRRERKLHRDWRIWVAVILMLAAMLAYLLTQDERIVPGATTGGSPTQTNNPPSP